MASLPSAVMLVVALLVLVVFTRLVRSNVVTS
jgi:hypothetical protein